MRNRKTFTIQRDAQSTSGSSVPNGQAGARDAARAVLEDITALVRAEVGLAKAEVEQSVREKAAGAGLLAGAGALVWLGAQGLLIALALALALVLPGWAAALIVSGMLLLAGAALGLLGKRRLAAKLSLDTTRRNVEEDIAWTKSHLPNTGS
jgi:hypothetical protein